MSLGNGNPFEGDKGSNFNYELKVLQGLETIAELLEAQSQIHTPKILDVDTYVSLLVTNTVSNTIVGGSLIPANTFTSGFQHVLNVIARYQFSGLAAIATGRIYVNDTTTLIGAAQIAAISFPIVSRYAQFTREFVCILTGGGLTIEGYSDSTTSDMTTSPISVVQAFLDPTIDQYIIFTIQLSSLADQARKHMQKVTLYSYPG